MCTVWVVDTLKSRGISNGSSASRAVPLVVDTCNYRGISNIALSTSQSNSNF